MAAGPAVVAADAEHPLVAVTGATGLLGANVAILLREQGFLVRCTKRASSKIPSCLQNLEGLDWVDGDILDLNCLERAFRGAKYVIHCAAGVYQERYASQAQIDANVQGTANVVAAVLSQGVRRLIHCSSVVTVAIASSFSAPASESDAWNIPAHGLDDSYAVTKRDSENLVLSACRDRRLDAVVCNPTYMIGPHDPGDSSASLVVKLMQGMVPGIPGGAMNFVDVRDVARGMLLALEKGVSGERYILGGHNLTWGSFYALVGRVSGSRVPTWHVPYVLAATLGWWGTLRGDRHGLNICPVRWAFVSTFTFTSAKAERVLGYRPSPLEPAIAATVASFKERGLLPSQ